MKYSIITPVYNRADCIERCIKSVCKNTKYGISLEHIIVDDGSTDNTAEIVSNYLSENKHIKFIPFATNKGTNAARNAAINNANGEFCILLDSDDYFVDNAIQLIDGIVSTGGFEEYMFAADDMVEKYSKNQYLSGNKSIVLHYLDFLSGKINGDFIHVISTTILKNNLFLESLRIHEGVIFLKFYKQSKNILFTNEIVTIRERSRSDSVTRETIRIKKNHIERNLLAANTMLEYFRDDLEEYGLYSRLSQLLLVKVENSILLSKYDDIENDINSAYFTGRKARLMKLIYKLRLGWLYNLFLYCFLFSKYKIFNSKLK